MGVGTQVTSLIGLKYRNQRFFAAKSMSRSLAYLKVVCAKTLNHTHCNLSFSEIIFFFLIIMTYCKITESIMKSTKMCSSYLFTVGLGYPAK